MGQRKTDVRRFHYAEPIRVVRLASMLRWAVVGGEDLDYLDVDDIEEAVRTWAARRRHEVEVDLTGKSEYIIDGDKFSTVDEFAAHFTQVVGHEGRLFVFEWDGGVGHFDEILDGWHGTPPGGFVIRWRNSSRSRDVFGYEMMVAELEESLRRSTPSLDQVPTKVSLDAARRGMGPTVFDDLVEWLRRHAPGGPQDSGVELILE